MPITENFYYCDKCNIKYNSWKESYMCEIRCSGKIKQLKEIVELIEKWNKYKATITIKDIEKSEKKLDYKFFDDLGDFVIMDKEEIDYLIKIHGK